MTQQAMGSSVLIVAEGRSFYTLLESMLRAVGVQATTTIDNHDAARNWLRTNAVDLILVDHDMAKCCPFDFSVRLRTDERQACRTSPLVLMSGTGERMVIQKAQQAGYDSVMPKPIRAAHLASELERLMEKPRVYIRSANGYCGPDRRRRVMVDYDGRDRREGSFQVFTEDGPVSLDTLERLERSSAARGDMQVLLVRGREVLAGYRFNSREIGARRRA